VADPMLKFVSRPRQPPTKRPAEARGRDFHEIYQAEIFTKVGEQAARCSQCGVPFCQTHCPLQNNIPDWLKLTAEGRLQEAYEVAAATNSMPEICGRICPQDRLCEGNCVIEQSGHGTVTIGAVEKYITDTAWTKGWVAPVRPVRERSESVGIVGAGPAGLAAAESLRLKGYKVTVYDRHDRPGGLLIYGIPNFKLEKDVVARRTERLVEGGVDFQLNCEVGKDVGFAVLRARHDTLLLAPGVYKARDLDVPNARAKNVVPAMAFLTAANRIGLGDQVADFASGRLNAQGKAVVVIGGGDTAMDCVRTAVRQGAQSVTCLYRRDRENMPGSRAEVLNAEEEGVQFRWLAQPRALSGTLRKATTVVFDEMRLGRPDAAGRRVVEAVAGVEGEARADMVILALGYDADDVQTTFATPDLDVTRWGTLKINYKTMMTNIAGVFAAGDIVRGASLVVWAIREGRDAADNIHAYLREKARADVVAAQ
jgi:glutamate synthase (NADPH) small chain